MSYHSRPDDYAVDNSIVIIEVRTIETSVLFLPIHPIARDPCCQRLFHSYIFCSCTDTFFTTGLFRMDELLSLLPQCLNYVTIIEHFFRHSYRACVDIPVEISSR